MTDANLYHNPARYRSAYWECPRCHKRNPKHEMVSVYCPICAEELIDNLSAMAIAQVWAKLDEGKVCDDE